MKEQQKIGILHPEVHFCSSFQVLTHVPAEEAKIVEVSKDNIYELLALVQKGRAMPAFHNLNEGSITLLKQY